MRRRNLSSNPSEVLSKIDGNKGNWMDFVNSSSVTLPAGSFIFSCNITKTGATPYIQIWNETKHEQLESRVPAVGANTLRCANPEPVECHFAICGCEATDFAIESADTYENALGGGLPGFFVASTAPY